MSRVNALHSAVPDAEIVVVGMTDGYSNIHPPDERVLIDEFERAILAETEFLGAFAERTAAGR